MNIKFKMLKGNIFLLFCLHLMSCTNCISDFNSLPAILEEFKINKPIILNTKLGTNDLANVVKHLSFKGFSISFSQNKQNNLPYQSYLIFSNLRNFKWNQTTYAPILVVSRIKNEIDFMQVDVSIGCQVLFIDWFSLKVYESYTVNKVHVTKYLGQFEEIKKGMNGLIFIPSKDYTHSMEKRRGNFYGLQIKTATDKKGLGISDLADYSNQIKFFPNNNTYDVTNMNFTFDHDQLPLKILKWMEVKLNFTAQLFLRKDDRLGLPKVSNGSIFLEHGLFQDMFEGSYDFLLCKNLMMLREMEQFGTFLPPMYSIHDAIYIPVRDSGEDLDMNVFFSPFSTKLWFAMLLKCIIFSMFVFVIEWSHNYNMVRKFINYIF